MYIEHLILEEYDSLTSTQDFAKTKIDLKPFTVISTKLQTKGHGRHGRTWLTNPGDIAITIVIPLPKNHPEQVSYVTGIAVRETLAQFAINAQLKWVNDVLVAEKKISGIILEMHKSLLLIGIGINIHPIEIENSTSINQHNASAKCDEVIATLLEEFKKHFNSWSATGFSAIKNQWLAHAYKLGNEIKANSQTGIFENIDEEGNLILKTTNGILKISAGEIFS